MSVHDLARDAWYIDVQYLGAPHLIACAVLETREGLVLIDPGPSTSLEGVRAGLERRGRSLADVHAILLTHIHLDHAGATGTVATANPEVQVYVHARGASHMMRPERLLRSARRLYQEDMDRLWGVMEPVPDVRVHALEGGETLVLGGRTLDVAYTPGHAVHHVSYFDRATRIAFVGDTTGMAVAGADYVIPVTPPPDIDLDRWPQSLNRILDWSPERLFLTHFGPAENPDEHMEAFRTRLDAWATAVRRDVDLEVDNAASSFAEDCQKRWDEDIALPYRAAYERFGLPSASWQGLARYWRRQRR